MELVYWGEEDQISTVNRNQCVAKVGGGLESSTAGSKDDTIRDGVSEQRGRSDSDGWGERPGVSL